MPFFRAHLGFDCPVRKGVADFLQEVALPSDQQASRQGARWGLGGGLACACAVAVYAARAGRPGCTPIPPHTHTHSFTRCCTSAPRATLPRRPQKYWVDNTRPYRYVTAQAIRQSFWDSEASADQRALLAAPPAPDGAAADGGTGLGAEAALTTDKYGASYWRLVRANFVRSLILQLRSKLFM